MFANCIKHIKDHLHITYDKDLIIDPNAFDVSFMDGIETLTRLNLFYNKNPMHENVMPLDFLQINFARFDKTILAGLWYDDVHLVSYPPPELAEQYIRLACTFAQSVSFIIPKSAQYAFSTNYQKMFSVDLAEKGLVFQIWLKADY